MAMKVCVDPGHGMSARRWGVVDPGVIVVDPEGVVHREADVVLRWGRSLKEALIALDLPAVLTREDAGDHAPVGRRGYGASVLRCNLLLSLHLAPVGSRQALVVHGSGDGSPLAVQLAESLAAALDAGVEIKAERGEPIAPGFEAVALRIELGDLADAEHREMLLDPARRIAVCAELAACVARPRHPALLPPQTFA